MREGSTKDTEGQIRCKDRSFSRSREGDIHIGSTTVSVHGVLYSVIIPFLPSRQNSAHPQHQIISMSPPAYVDLGKDAKDLFTKEYNHGFLKVETTTRAGEKEEVEFKTGAVHTIASGRMAGNLDVKYKIPSYGITLTEKWNTDNMLGTIIEVQDQFARGLKLTLDSSYAPQVGKRTGKVKAEWAAESAKVTCDLGLDVGPILNVAAVAAHQGWLLAFGRTGPNYTLHSFVNDGQEFGASLYHRAAHNVEVGAQLGWTVGDQGARFALAAKYCPAKDLELKAKVDNQSKVAFAATHHLTNQLKLILSTQFGLNTLNEGGHKFGLGLVYTQ
uniref:Voltage-dependent anion-selective channel protein 3 n=1 Tax=Ascaris lumbricoides TaxID=6252 RepID=A0A9J2PMM4_ASCLU